MPFGIIAKSYDWDKAVTKELVRLIFRPTIT
jgi:hypothetical protein